LLALLIIGSSAVTILRKRLSVSYPGKKYWREKREKWRIERRVGDQRAKSVFLLAGIAIGLATGIPIGYTAHEDPLPKKNILVLKTRDVHHFRVQTTDNGKKYEVTTCPDSPEDWQPGEKMKEAFWEDRLGCMSFRGHNLGFQFYTQEDSGKRTIFPIEEEEVADGR